MDVQSIFNAFDEGLFVLDENLRIQWVNLGAKRLLGIEPSVSEASQRDPVLNQGDLVIIADNELGCDDGALDCALLEHIGIVHAKIEPGNVLVAIGCYGQEDAPSFYRAWGKNSSLVYRVEEGFMGENVSVVIDELQKIISICINAHCFTLDFVYCIGHMVVLEAETHAVKFVQAKGYTFRREGIGDLLRGKRHSGALSHGLAEDLIGLHISRVGACEELIECVEAVKRTGKGLANACIEINRYPVFCSVTPLITQRVPTGFLIRFSGVETPSASSISGMDLLKGMIQSDERIRRREDFPHVDVLQGISGNSPQMINVKSLGYKASKIPVTVLITGESGTGKSLLAKEIHKASGRVGAFVHVNCSAIPDSLFESELFGYVPGAFTGASKAGKAGFFKAAEGGTLFLDEVGELPLHIQSKLLYALQEHKYYRVGDAQPLYTDARVIAATNIQLEAAMAEGRFRKDLYYRLNVFPIHMPPIRQRKKDMYSLVDDLLRSLSIQFETPPKRLSKDALEKILLYNWPGNVRELENVLSRAIIVSEGTLIYPEHISIAEGSVDMPLKDILSAAEKRAILEMLDACNGNKQIAMRKLCISKSAFYEKLKKYGIG